MQMCKKTKFVQAISDLVLFPGQLWLKSPNVLISIETDFILQDLQYFSQPQSKKRSEEKTDKVFVKRLWTSRTLTSK